MPKHTYRGKRSRARILIKDILFLLGLLAYIVALSVAASVVTVHLMRWLGV